MHDEPKNICYNSCVLNQPGVHMFLCLYTMAVGFGVSKAFFCKRIYRITAIMSCVLSKCTVHIKGAHPGAQAKHSSLDFLIMVDDSPYFLLEQKFLDGFSHRGV